MLEPLEPYQDKFSGYYDLLYSDKNYTAECDLIQSIFERYGNPRPQTIVDAGCGSGSHAIILGSRGFEVIGIDRSESLLSIAREKTRSKNLNIPFMKADLRSFDVEDKSDA